MRLSVLVGLSWIVIVGLVGCGKLKYDRTETLEPGDMKTYTIDGPSSQQVVRVKLKADEEVSLAVIPARDFPAPFSLDNLEKVKAYATKANAKEFDLEATIPAKVDFMVLVYGAKKSTPITLNIQGK